MRNKSTGTRAYRRKVSEIELAYAIAAIGWEELAKLTESKECRERAKSLMRRANYWKRHTYKP